MIKLKDILLEGKPPSIFVPRRIEDRLERMIKIYIRNGSKGDLNLNSMNLKKLPEILNGITIHGNFYFYDNKLTTLKNSPKIVVGYFSCRSNKLTSLIGGPEYVEFFDCRNNQLTSLKGAPEMVGGFDCSFNKKQFTTQDVKAVCSVNGRIYV